jgi:hypothetical protein
MIKNLIVDAALKSLGDSDEIPDLAGILDDFQNKLLHWVKTSGVDQDVFRAMLAPIIDLPPQDAVSEMRRARMIANAWSAAARPADLWRLH